MGRLTNSRGAQLNHRATLLKNSHEYGAGEASVSFYLRPSERVVPWWKGRTPLKNGEQPSHQIYQWEDGNESMSCGLLDTGNIKYCSSSLNLLFDFLYGLTLPQPPWKGRPPFLARETWIYIYIKTLQVISSRGRPRSPFIVSRLQSLSSSLSPYMYIHCLLLRNNFLWISAHTLD